MAKDWFPPLFMKTFLLLLGMGALMNSSCTDPSDGESTSPNNTPTQDQKVTIEDVEAGIRAHIEQQTGDGDGYFHYENDSVQMDLRLVRVHTEYLSILGPDQYFACVDLATESGDVYDMDFFLKGEVGQMQVTRTDLHKLNGKPYYTWRQAEDDTWHTVPVEEASQELLGVVEGQDQFTFYYTVEIPEIEEEASAWIPIAQSDEFQEIELKELKVPGEQKMLQDPKYGNQILHLQLKPSHSGEKIRIAYRVIRKEKSAYKSEETNIQQYLSETPFLPVGGRFQEIAQRVVNNKEANTPLTKARALYDYIIDSLRYAKQGTYGTADANFACDVKSGNCTEFHSLFISLARSIRIPARFAVGAAIPSERDEGGVNGYHCWAEFYAEGKWWPVDISEGNKYSALATYYFGHHPANRIEITKGRNIEVEPGPTSGPFEFLVYPLLEIDGKEEVLSPELSFQRPS